MGGSVREPNRQNVWAFVLPAKARQQRILPRFHPDFVTKRS